MTSRHWLWPLQTQWNQWKLWEAEARHFLLACSHSVPQWNYSRSWCHCRIYIWVCQERGEWCEIVCGIPAGSAFADEMAVIWPKLSSRVNLAGFADLQKLFDWSPHQPQPGKYSEKLEGNKMNSFWPKKTMGWLTKNRLQNKREMGVPKTLGEQASN